MSLVDRRIFQAAVSLMEQYTLQAEAYATSRADQAADEGDTAQAVIWHLVASVIEELQRERGPGELLN